MPAKKENLKIHYYYNEEEPHTTAYMHIKSSFYIFLKEVLTCTRN